ncbi:MAG: hypothetical protein L0I24_03440 [Pseudonocardia sp.]|nr:hypothetical protein [Pseudonocardia sp.]
MGTIPTLTTIGSGVEVTSTYLNAFKAASDFWALTPRAYVYQSSVTSIANSAASWTLLPFQAEIFDVANNYDGGGDSPMHDNSTNPSRVYARTTGKYEINGQVQFVLNATGYRSVQVRLNSAGSGSGGSQIALNVVDASSAALVSVQIPTIEVALTAGDYVEAFGQQNSGGALNTVVGAGISFLRGKLSGA